MDINYTVEFPVACPIRFTFQGSPSDVRANIDQRRYFDTINATTERRRYIQPWEQLDAPQMEVYTKFPLRRIRIVDCDGEDVVAQMSWNELRDYRNKVFAASCKFSSIGGKLFIYFEDSLIEDEIIHYDGVLPPVNIKVGDLASYNIADTGDDAGIITAIAWHPVLEAQGYLLDVDYELAETADGNTSITYNERDANLYARILDFSGLDGEYFVICEFGAIAYTYSFLSEPIEIREKHAKTLALEYWHEGTFDKEDQMNYVYDGGYKNKLRFPADFYQLVVGGEVEADVDDGMISRILMAMSFRQVRLVIRNIPSWLADKIEVALTHDHKEVNGYRFEITDLGEFNIIDRTDIGTYEVVLRQVDDRMLAKWGFVEDISAYFDPAMFFDIPFEGDTMQSTFHSSVSGIFRFINLPAWIQADKVTFGDGDVINFTVLANEGQFDRIITLVAKSDDIPELQATIQFTQDLDDSAPDYIAINPNDATLERQAGSFKYINVSASDEWEAAVLSGWEFQIQNVDPAGSFEVAEATENDTNDYREGIIRVSIVGNPSVFVDLTVRQKPRVPFKVGPEIITMIGPIGGETFATVQAPDDMVWQAISNRYSSVPGDSLAFVNFDQNPQVGSKQFRIFVFEKPTWAMPQNSTDPPRTATITFQNVNNPSESRTITVRQMWGPYF